MNTKIFKNKTILLSIIILLTVISIGTPFFSYAQISPEERARLEAELKVLEQEIAKKEKELKSQKGESTSLSKEINTLRTQIDKAKLNIKAKNLEITKIGSQINEKSSTINELEEKIADQKDSLSQLIRKTNDLDSTNMIHLLLSGKDLSEFYSDADSLASIKKALRSTVLSVKDTKSLTEEEKILLEEKKDEELNAKAELERTRQKVETDQAYQKRLLSISQNKEKEYERVLAENRAKANQIKARLFNFAGGATAAIPFGTALQFAEEAEKRTGTPAAFVLAILTQESALGANVGQCYLTNTTTGAGVGKNTGRVFINVMKPTRDVGPFLQITQALGMDPFKTVVSCPIPNIPGWGGAMGPAQFIASTWQLIAPRVRAITGSANPWNARDSIIASATYLSDLGANSTYAAQIKAACKYYGTGGATCGYGTSVMSRVNKIQADIDYLKKYGTKNN